MTNKEKLDKIIRSLGSFLWLSNNQHNFHTTEFKEMLEASMEEVREAYKLAIELEQEIK